MKYEFKDPEYPSGLDEVELKNDMNGVPDAACPRCGGWTSVGGMSQYSQSKIQVNGRTGCFCDGKLKKESLDEDIDGYMKRVRDLESLLEQAGSAASVLQKDGELDFDDKRNLRFIVEKIMDSLALVKKLR